MIAQANGITFEQNCLIQTINPSLFETIFGRRPECITLLEILSSLFSYLIVLGIVVGAVALFLVRHNQKWKRRILILESFLLALFIIRVLLL